MLSTFPSGQPHAPPVDAHIAVVLRSSHVAVGTQPEMKICPSAGHITTGKWPKHLMAKYKIHNVFVLCNE